MIRIKKDIEIQAIQFINTPERIEEIRKMFNKDKIEVRYQEDKKITLVFWINKNLLYVNENDWIVKYPFVDLRGFEYLTMPDEEFKEYFEIVL